MSTRTFVSVDALLGGSSQNGSATAQNCMQSSEKCERKKRLFLCYPKNPSYVHFVGPLSHSRQVMKPSPPRNGGPSRDGVCVRGAEKKDLYRREGKVVCVVWPWGNAALVIKQQG